MKYTVVIISLLYAVTGIAQTTKTIKSKPDKATIYITGAELSHNEALLLNTGLNEIILEGVSPYLDENSISAMFKGGGFVVDTRKSYRYPEQPKIISSPLKYAREIKAIQDSLEDLEFLMKDVNNKQDAFTRERNLLLNNRLMRGEFAKDSLALLKNSLDLLRSRLINIDELALVQERKLSKFTKLQATLTERLEYLTLLQENGSEIANPESAIPIYQVIVTINTEQNVSGNLILKYYLSNAGWVPMYDIQATSGKDKIQLVYRAQVYQNSGVDWKDLDLKLSTSNPAYGNVKPVLSPWYLFFNVPVPAGYGNNAPMINSNVNQYRYQMAEKKLSTTARKNNTDDMEEDIEGDGPVTPQPIFNISDNFMNTEYDIKIKYSIAADNKPHHVIINSVEIPVSLTYSSIPKLDKDAFLMGKIAQWEDWNLIPGNAKIYFDESYIGQTVIDAVTTKDTLYLNLGRDRSIAVKRMIMKDKCKDQYIGDNRVITKVVEIVVRNTKAVELPFEIEDQIPITTDQDIKITMLDNDKASYTEETGRLAWRFNLKPKDLKRIRFSYEVKYPKDKQLSGL